MIFYVLKKSYLPLCIIFLTIIMLIIQFPQNNLTTYEGRVLNISKNYYTIKTEEAKVLLYTNSDLNYNDYIRFSGEYLAIESVESKVGFNFQDFMLKNNIKYSIKSKQVEIIKNSNSLKAQLNNKIKQHQSKDYLTKVLLDYSIEDIDASLSTLVLSSGLIIRELIRFLKSILSKFIYSNYTDIIELSLLILYLLIMKNFQFTIFLIITRLINKTKFERLDKISLSSILILIIFPNYLFSLSFQITNLFRFAYFIKIRKSNLFLNYVVLIPFQLINFYEVSLFQIIIFPYNKLINVIYYLFAYVDVFIKTNISINISKLFLLENKILNFSGHMNIIILFLWIILSLKLLQKIKFRYVLAMVILLYINQYQLIFNPTLTYTQVYIGQGDLAIITYPFKYNVVLIDTGSSFNQSKLEDYLNYYGIKNIHTIIISHYDEDHSGNLEYLESNYHVSNVIDNINEFYFHKLKINSIKYDYEDNDGSLITYFKINEVTYLSLGDISKEIENLFIKDYDYIDYNIIKLAHHGSKTSTSSQLLNKESLFLALNSSGRNNMYNHPNTSVLKSLDDYQIPLLDTQDYGDIRIIHFFNYNFIVFK